MKLQGKRSGTNFVAWQEVSTGSRSRPIHTSAHADIDGHIHNLHPKNGSRACIQMTSKMFRGKSNEDAQKD
eukprot:5462618-Karenia_brevis.AAC.1